MQLYYVDDETVCILSHKIIVGRDNLYQTNFFPPGIVQGYFGCIHSYSYIFVDSAVNDCESPQDKGYQIWQNGVIGRAMKQIEFLFQ